jgi:hypothetical protein
MNHRSALQTAAVGTTHALMPLSGPVPVTPVYRGQRQSSKRGLRAEAERQRVR